MKILIFVAVLVAVCGQSAVNVQADVIECNFKDFHDHKYACIVESVKHDENKNVIKGNHETGKSDSDVLLVYFYSFDSQTLTNFDSIFCQKFPNLERINFENVKPVNLVKNALNGCQHLKNFQLFGAEIKQIPDNFFSNSLKLIDLSLDQNRLETLPENLFSSLNELEKVDLTHNQLNYLPENVFKPLTKLSELWLDDNRLSTLNHGWFVNGGNLLKLSLGSNKIAELPQNIFVSLEKLEKLWLENNNLVTIHADSFGKKPQLTLVNLSNNKITSIDEKFINDTAVAWLNMNGNSCNQEDITSLENIKEKLQVCFDNYQPRPVPSTSSAAPPKHKIKWNLWLSLSLLTFSFWKF